MENRNTITFKLSIDEANELYYAIDEREAELRDKCRDSLLSPECRKTLQKRYETAHNLRIRLGQALDEQSAQLVTAPTFGPGDMADFVYRALGGLSSLPIDHILYDEE